jgi:hypothetical protein
MYRYRKQGRTWERSESFPKTVSLPSHIRRVGWRNNTFAGHHPGAQSPSGGTAVDPPRPPEDGRHACATQEVSSFGGSHASSAIPAKPIVRIKRYRKSNQAFMNHRVFQAVVIAAVCLWMSMCLCIFHNLANSYALEKRSGDAHQRDTRHRESQGYDPQIRSIRRLQKAYRGWDNQFNNAHRFHREN